MKELVEVIAKSLVDNPSEVVVTETVSGDDLLLELKVDPSDMGKVIFIVTHDFEFVSRTCSRILHFDEGEMPDDVPVTMDTLPTLRELFSISESRPGRTEHRKSRFCSADC